MRHSMVFQQFHIGRRCPLDTRLLRQTPTVLLAVTQFRFSLFTSIGWFEVDWNVLREYPRNVSSWGVYRENGICQKHAIISESKWWPQLNLFFSAQYSIPVMESAGWLPNNVSFASCVLCSVLDESLAYRRLKYCLWHFCLKSWIFESAIFMPTGIG